MKHTLMQIAAGTLVRVNGDRSLGTMRSRILGDVRSHSVPSLLRRGFIAANITDPSPRAWYVARITDAGRQYLNKTRGKTV